MIHEGNVDILPIEVKLMVAVKVVEERNEYKKINSG